MTLERVGAAGDVMASVRRVLDTSALLSGRQFPGEVLTVPEVLRELKRQGLTSSLEAVLETQVAIASPDRATVARVKAASDESGDTPRLSRTDIELLALALETAAVLVTDDYSMQNVAVALRIPYEGILAPGILERWTWSYRCTGCGAIWPAWHEACPTCGARLRTWRRGSRESGGRSR